eukprot:gb/GFBE01017572.1/.p1 GENE.gb/GFBE01017572.1/~~gb/GFBE01017572.1/.p1  ORF type:complete len:264 (+),score=61.54 gb/GFBE01017572.1/:1-792(+)
MPVRLLTFNIWFAEHAMLRRMQAIGDIIQSTLPDVIALQEMTHEHWELCRRHEAFASYTWSGAPPRQRYYTLIGSRLPFVQEPLRQEFEVTLMGRDLLYAIVQPPGLPPLVFATSHLESLDRAKVRKTQIEESLKMLGKAADVVFCGDTNINEAVDGDVQLPSPWQDAWVALKPEDPGYTFDVSRNRMMAQHDNWARENNARLRFDRFWFKVSNYAPTAIDLLDNPIEGDLWPSDHFGLLLTLEEWRQNRGDLGKKTAECSVS